ncbi:MAG: hypothetical protein ACAH95_08550 [Fimbriimonas sp.]
MRRKTLAIQLLACLIAVALIAISATGAVMRRDGMSLQELWDRKKGLIRTASPEAGSAVDKAESAIRD